MTRLIVTSDEAGLLPEQFLQQRIPAAPVSYLRRLVKSGKIRGVAGPVSGTTLLAGGDELFLPDSVRLRALCQLPAEPPLSVLYETGHLLCVDKPAGLATHAGVGHEQQNLTARVERYLQERSARFMVAPIQRLDRETSGVVLFGKGKKACSVLGQMMMSAPVRKTYLALVAGQVSGDGVLVSEIPAKGTYKRAETAYQCLVSNEHASLLRIRLHTGRQHQIRRQFRDIGHPLFGDRRFRGPDSAALGRLFLHCCRLEFTDPFSSCPLCIDSRPPAILTDFLHHLGLSLPEEFYDSDEFSARDPREIAPASHFDKPAVLHLVDGEADADGVPFVVEADPPQRGVDR
ncbi:MAG: RluA family pseudouridine synthase [Desulfuromonadales bacterium]|nr:RluA family pseudouridine synthase [Desulfuromonadales bacterium]